MNSVERVKALCKERKIPISRLERDLGFANGYIGQLRKGTFPDDRLIKIAKYLDVTPAYITGWTSKSKTVFVHGTEHTINIPNTAQIKYDSEKRLSKYNDELTKKDERDISRDLNSIMQKLQSGEDGPATFDGQELSPESAELFRIQLESMLTQLKVINKEKYNPNKNKK